MTNGRYILDGKGYAVPEPNLMKWANWMETADRRIAQTTVGDYKVSTVFLGLDYSFNRGVPLLYETMVFRGNFDDIGDYTARYSTQPEALMGHKETVDKLQRLKK